MPKAKKSCSRCIIGIMLLCMFLLCGCGGSGGSTAEADSSGKVAIFGEAQYDAGYTFAK